MDVNFAGMDLNVLRVEFFVFVLNRLMNTIAPNSIPKVNTGE
jgi:hypothetical protein